MGNIQTKFELKQLVWYLHEGKIWRGAIQNISVSKSDCQQSEVYNVNIGDCGSRVNKRGDELFGSKELFIESIS